MKSTIFLHHVRAWLDLMEAGEFAMAARSALDAGAVGRSLARELDLANESLGLSAWRGKPSSELLDGLTGFLCNVATASEAEACRRGGEEPQRARRPNSGVPPDDSA